MTSRRFTRQGRHRRPRAPGLPAGRRSAASRRFQLGITASALGDAVFSTAAAAVSGVPAVTYAAVALAGPVAGLVVDRFSRRTVMAVTDPARALLVGE